MNDESKPWVLNGSEYALADPSRHKSPDTTGLLEALEAIFEAEKGGFISIKKHGNVEQNQQTDRLLRNARAAIAIAKGES